MNGTPALSVVIPTFQRRASVARAIAALGTQNMPPERYEVIVSVDGSADGTFELVSRAVVPFRLRGLWSEHGGRAAACNAGIAAAAGALIVILDDDMEPSPAFLEAHERAHLAHGRRGVMGAVPIRISPSDPPVVQFVGRKFNAHLDALSAPGYALKLKDFYTGNFSVEASVLHEVSGFDEAFRIYGNEDLELALRLRGAGVELLLDRAAWARQHYNKSLDEVARDQIAKGRTAVLLAQKHPEAVPELKLGTFARASRKWRATRALLLAVAASWPGSSAHVARAVGRLTERRPGRAPRVLPLLFDYLFWAGVAAARREVGAPMPAGPVAVPAGR